jgi:hypothetical protein
MLTEFTQFLVFLQLCPEMEFLNGIFSRGSGRKLESEFLCGFLPSFFRSTVQNAFHE